MPVIGGLTFQVPLEQFQIPLLHGFAFSPAVNKLYLSLSAYLLQKTADFLEVLYPVFGSHMEGLDELLVYTPHGRLDFHEHFFFPFSNGFFPYERVFIGTGFYFRSINKDGFFGKFICPLQPAYHLIKEVLTCFLQKTGTEPGNGAVIRRFLSG